MIGEILRRASVAVALALSVACGDGGNTAGTSRSLDEGDQAGEAGEGSGAPPVVETFVSDTILEPIFSLSSLGGKLYATTEYALVEIDAASGAKRTIGGNTLSYGDGERAQYSFAPVLSSQHAFLVTAEGALAAVKVSSDSATAIELAPPQSGLQKDLAPNFVTIGAGPARTYWALTDGRGNLLVFSQEHGKPVSSTPLLTVPGEYAALAATHEYLYLHADGSSADRLRRVYRYSLATREFAAVYQQPRQQDVLTTNLPLVVDSRGAYWADGSKIFFAAHGAASAEPFATLPGTVSRMVSAQSHLYVYYLEHATVERVITRIDGATGARTDLVRLGINTTPGLAFAVAGPQVYVALDQAGITVLYALNAMGQLDPVLDVTREHKTFGVQGMTSAGAKLILSGHDPVGLWSVLVIYDPATGEAISFRPATRAMHLAASGSLVHFAGIGNVGIGHLDVSLPMRAIQRLATPDAVETSPALGGTQEGSFVYLAGRFAGDPSATWRIVRARPDGSEYQTLMRSSSELRDPVVIGEQLYFLCLATCGAPQWVLASMSTAGAPFTAQFLIPDLPRLYGRGGYLYLAGTSDGSSSDIFAINTATLEPFHLVTGIPHGAVSLRLSDNWLYWAGRHPFGLGGAIARHRWQSATAVGPIQIIADGSADPFLQLRVDTIALSSGHLFYWHAGLKKVVD